MKKIKITRINILMYKIITESESIELKRKIAELLGIKCQVNFKYEDLEENDKQKN